jgi:uncharacterized protein YjbI with pentapeptide repeats
MANKEQLKLLLQGVATWNEWRKENPDVSPDLSQTHLGALSLAGANLSGANLSNSDLGGSDLRGANLTGASLNGSHFDGANLSGANLIGANLNEVNFAGTPHRLGQYLGVTELSGINLSGADLRKVDFSGLNLSGLKFNEANLCGTNLSELNFSGADLSGANLRGANLTAANLSGASLCRADLSGMQLIGTDLSQADLTGCSIYGIAAWDVKVDSNTRQDDLMVTPRDQPAITVDNIKVAQFIYLLLNNEEIRDVIDTIGKKGVLLLGRFTEGRIAVLERLRTELRQRGFVPMVFNFDKPQLKDFTETVRLLASLSRFVIVDITNPRSTPLELQATVPECMVPFVPILEKGEEPFAMFRDLWIKHRDWVLEPIRYPSVDRLIEALNDEIIYPAQERFAKLVARKVEEVRVKDI